MLLTVTSTAAPATDLGFLLHKHPGKVQSFDLAVGTAHVFYPEATEERCTAALLFEVDPIAPVRGRPGADPRGGATFSLAQYVNDRPYAASSMLAVALGRVFRTAIAGRCEARPELPEKPLPLTIHAPAVPWSTPSGWRGWSAPAPGNRRGESTRRSSRFLALESEPVDPDSERAPWLTASTVGSTNPSGALNVDAAEFLENLLQSVVDHVPEGATVDVQQLDPYAFMVPPPAAPTGAGSVDGTSSCATPGNRDGGYGPCLLYTSPSPRD